MRTNEKNIDGELALSGALTKATPNIFGNYSVIQSFSSATKDNTTGVLREIFSNILELIFRTSKSA